jgi:hypothetical protein
MVVAIQENLPFQTTILMQYRFIQIEIFETLDKGISRNFACFKVRCSFRDFNSKETPFKQGYNYTLKIFCQSL